MFGERTAFRSDTPRGISTVGVPASPSLIVGGDYLALMRRLDELHLEHPFAGSRMLRDLLAAVVRSLIFEDGGIAMPVENTEESRAVLDRASVLSDIRTLNPLVEESLVILAAGGLTPAALPHGMNEVRELHSTMHENRIKRLQLVGFDHSEAGELSTLHTANFM